MNTLAGACLTFLLTDVEGSTRAWEQDPDSMSSALARHDEIVDRIVGARAGRVIKERGEGDSAFCVFERTRDAVAAALELQRALEREQWPTRRPLRVRMAIHTGPAESRGADYYGPVVNRCARLRGAGHGGQVLLSDAAREAVTDALGRDALEGVRLANLGSHRLKDLTEPEQIHQLVHADLPQDFPPLATLDVSTDLPVQPTPLVGRDKEVAEASNLLLRHDVRLLTLTGSGGVGKTRLGLQVAAETAGDFPDGVSFVPLAPVQDHALVVDAIARVVGVRETKGDDTLLESLKAFLSDKRMLLLLDNFEHLLEAAVDLADLLEACPLLNVLATSRERLRIRAERRFDVGPLPLPSTAETDPEELKRIGSVTLFTERARDVLPDFTLTTENAVTVAAICQRLEGLPLAIELAAARIDELPPPRLLHGLERRLDMLTEGARDLPERHQTMRSAVAWSYGLLSADEQTAFRRLAAFAGGGPVDAVTPVCDPAGELEIEEVLRALERKSLLRLEEPVETERRFGLLETIREFAWDELVNHDETMQTQALHGEWYTELAERAEPELKAVDQMVWLARLDREHDNLRLALDRCQSTDPDQAMRLAVALAPFWEARGHLSEGRRRLAAIRAQVRPSDLHHWKALTGEAALARAQGDYAIARARFSEALDLARSLGDPQLLAFSLHSVGLVAWNLGDTAEARRRFEETIEVVAPEDRRNFALGITGLGLIAWHDGDYERAQERYRESLAILHEIGDLKSVANVLPAMATAAQSQGDYRRAREFFVENLRLAREIGDRRQIAWLLHNLGSLSVDQGDYDGAEQLLTESLDTAMDLGEEALATSARLNLARVALQCRSYDRARELAGRALEDFRRLGDERTAASALVTLGKAMGPVDGRPALEEAVTVFRALDYTRGIAAALAALGDAERMAGEHERAEGILGEALALARSVEDKGSIVATLLSLGELERHTGHNDRALGRHGEALRTAGELEDRRGIADALIGIALAGTGGPEDGSEVRLLSAAEDLYAEMGLEPPEGVRRALEAARNDLGTDAFERARDEGASAPIEDVIREALRAASPQHGHPRP